MKRVVRVLWWANKFGHIGARITLRRDFVDHKTVTHATRGNCPIFLTERLSIKLGKFGHRFEIVKKIGQKLQDQERIGHHKELITCLAKLA